MEYWSTPYSLLGLLILALDIVAIYSVLLGHSTVARKLLWTMLVLVLPVLGMFLYYLIGRSRQDTRLPA